MNKQLLKNWLETYKQKASSLKERAIHSLFDSKSEAIQTFRKELINKELKEFKNLGLIALRLHLFKSLEKYSFEEYIEKFTNLLDINQPIEQRINNAIEKSPYQLIDFDEKEITDLVCLNEPNKYCFFDENKIEPFISAFDIEDDIISKMKSKKYGDYFKAYNEVVREQILELYCKVIYGKESTSLNRTDLYSQLNLMFEIDDFVSWLVDFNGFRAIKYRFIENIKIQNFYEIKKNEIELGNLKDKRIIFLLGENGTGKTIFLKALLIALKQKFIDKMPIEDAGVILDALRNNKEMKVSVSAYNTKINYHLPNDRNNTKNDFYLNDCYAYGTQRNNISETEAAEKYGFLTLFNNDEYIININFWLKNLKLQEFERKNEKIFGIKDFEKILQDLLDIQDLQLIVSSQSKEVIFNINGQSKKFKELSEGYQSSINLVTDLVARLIENNPNIKSLKDLKKTQAVVLIDELDLFLHPKWEKSICGKLHSKFPNIQFFVTTHSPILIDGAVKDKRIDNKKIKIFKLDVQNGETVIEKEYNGKIIEDWSLDLLTHSQIFDDSYLTEEQRADIRLESNEHELLELGSKLKIVFQKEAELQRKYSENLNQ